MLPLHWLRAPLSEALVETSVTWLGPRSGDDWIGWITQIALVADEVFSPPLYGGEYRGGEKRAHGGPICALTESVFGLLPRA